MKDRPVAHRRRPMRAQGYDYADRGGYFVTVCTQGRVCLFGEVASGEMQLNVLGEIVRQEWFRTADARPGVFLDANEFIVMPNHIHGIIWIMNSARTESVGATRRVALTNAGAKMDTHETGLGAGTTHRVALTTETFKNAHAPGPQPGSVGAILGQFKSLTTKRINALRGTRGAPVWQRNYFEHIIRRGEALDRIRRYILENPPRWQFDREYPVAVGTARAGTPGDPQPTDRYPW